MKYRGYIMLVTALFFMLGGILVMELYEKKSDNIVYDLITFHVQRNEKGYSVVFNEYAESDGAIYFDKDGSMLSCSDVQPIRDEKAAIHLLEKIKTTTDMTELLGKPMADAGSGVYIPAYISDKGRILLFSLCGNTVVKYTIISITDSILSHDQNPFV